MTKAEPNTTTDTPANTEPKVESDANINPDQPRETLKLNPQAQDPTPSSPPTPQNLYDLERMSVEEKEQKAKEWGHIPKERFKGDQSRYIETDEFLKISQQKMPALKNQIKKQDNIIESLRSMNESLSESIEQQKADLTNQMQEASDNQDLVKFRNLEKREAALEKKQEDIQANLTNLKNDHQEEVYSASQEDMGRVVNQWVQKNAWFSDPKTTDDFKNKGFVDSRFRELSAMYPNAEPTMIINQIDSDLYKFNQPAPQSYGYTPGGNNVPMGQPPIESRTESHLNEGGKRTLNNILSVARDSTEKERLTKSFLATSQQYTWYKNN